MREWTREWWHKSKKNTLLLVGAPVPAELSKIPNPKGEKALQLLKDVFLLDYDASIDEIVTAYIRHKLMPSEAMGDAAHLALASFHKCDFLNAPRSRSRAVRAKFTAGMEIPTNRLNLFLRYT